MKEKKQTLEEKIQEAIETLQYVMSGYLDAINTDTAIDTKDEQFGISYTQELLNEIQMGLLEAEMSKIEEEPLYEDSPKSEFYYNALKDL